MASPLYLMFSTLEGTIIIIHTKSETHFGCWVAFPAYSASICITNKGLTECFILQHVFHTNMFTLTWGLFYSKGGANVGCHQGTH